MLQAPAKKKTPAKKAAAPKPKKVAAPKPKKTTATKKKVSASAASPASVQPAHALSTALQPKDFWGGSAIQSTLHRASDHLQHDFLQRRSALF